MSDTAMTQAPGTDHAVRVRTAADQVEELRDALHIAIERRDELIVEGADSWGMGHSELARNGRVSRTRVIAILGLH